MLNFVYYVMRHIVTIDTAEIDVDQDLTDAVTRCGNEVVAWALNTGATFWWSNIVPTNFISKLFGNIRNFVKKDPSCNCESFGEQEIFKLSNSILKKCRDRSQNECNVLIVSLYYNSMILSNFTYVDLLMISKC